ncbi:glycoprotein-N-acetylgalactosamine 3-beta-galactosyltransferase 1-like [Haliotis cracherodii]|uniref:glycoprotein-N-acetylgalactosamine 3-beta-galactosyltransferase 1-like n=1 Tax=Haliotis cracherodii TaxID=6455 RepID=UPI0039E761CF
MILFRNTSLLRASFKAALKRDLYMAVASIRDRWLQDASMNSLRRFFVLFTFLSGAVSVILLLVMTHSDSRYSTARFASDFTHLQDSIIGTGAHEDDIRLTEHGLDLFLESKDEVKDGEGNNEDFTLAVDNTVAEALSRKVRLACFITTREVNMETKLKAVNETWGKRCDKMLYVMTTNKTGPDILGVTIPDSHRTLTEKIVHAFTHMYNTSLDEYDWFLKADDDTYVIVENLKFLLAHLNASKPVYVGDHFAPFSPNGYMSGGAGYAVSREALRRLVEQGYRVPGRCRHAGGSEDIETGRCMYKVAVSTYLSLDKYNRSTFHGANPDSFQVGVANFISGFSANKYHSGPECCSQLTISFHYVKPELMRTLDMFLYQITVFGRTVKYKELWNLFRAEEFNIPQKRRRRPYPGETIEEYYKNATEWRLKNTTIYIPDKTKPKKKTGA